MLTIKYKSNDIIKCKRMHNTLDSVLNGQINEPRTRNKKPCCRKANLADNAFEHLVGLKYNSLFG